VVFRPYLLLLDGTLCVPDELRTNFEYNLNAQITTISHHDTVENHQPS
jgi:hypothetical protein